MVCNVRWWISRLIAVNGELMSRRVKAFSEIIFEINL